MAVLESTWRSPGLGPFLGLPVKRWIRGEYMTSSVLTGDIRQTLDHFRRSVDQLFENFYGFPAESARAGAITTGSQHWTFSPAVETAWGDTALNMRVIVPGVSQQDVKVSVQNNQLV